MRIALICLRGATNMASWRGNADALELHLGELGHEVVRMNFQDEYFPLFYKPKQVFHNVVLRRPYTRHHEPATMRFVGKIISERIRKCRPDVVLSLTAMPVPYMETSSPIVIWSDAPFDALLDFYENFTGLSEASIANGRRMERLAHDRAAFAVYTSKWGADAALPYTKPDRLCIVAFGANVPAEDENVSASGLSREASIELLWMGMEWKRKGGDVAVAVVEELNRRGKRARLTVAGTKPLYLPSDSSMIHYAGFVRGSAKRALLNLADFLILPSRADCSPLVIAEAYALGTPVIASRVGGIPAMVEDNVTGHTFDVDDIDGYASFVESALADRAHYDGLSANAHERYESSLNWRASSSGIVAVLEEAMRRTASQAI